MQEQQVPQCIAARARTGLGLNRGWCAAPAGRLQQLLHLGGGHGRLQLHSGAARAAGQRGGVLLRVRGLLLHWRLPKVGLRRARELPGAAQHLQLPHEGLQRDLLPRRRHCARAARPHLLLLLREAATQR